MFKKRFQMNITTYNDSYINSRLKDYQDGRYRSGVLGVYSSDADLQAAEEYENGYETGRDDGFYDGYLQCLKDLGIRQNG